MEHTLIDKTDIEKLPFNRQLANAFAYRCKTLDENLKHIWQEVISDAPHAYGLFKSSYHLFLEEPVDKVSSLHLQNITDLETLNEVYLQIVHSLAQCSIPIDDSQLTGMFALSMVSCISAFINIKTLINERKEQKGELKSHISLYKHFKKTHLDQTINDEAALELSGIPDIGVRDIDKKAIKYMGRSLNESFPNKVKRILRAPVNGKLITRAARNGFGVLKFTWGCAKDIFSNCFTPSGIRATAKGITNASEVLYLSLNKNRNHNKELRNLATIAEKIENAQKESPNSPAVISIAKKYKIEADAIGADKINHLDDIRGATRKKAKQLLEANVGFSLQSLFIASSICSAVTEGVTGNTISAISYFAAASLATSPFRGVVNFAHDLNSAIMSHRAEEAECLTSKEEKKIGLQDYEV